MKDLNPFDDNVKKRLGEHESPVPEDMFERILRERTSRLDDVQDASLRARLENHASVVPTALFDKITTERETRITNDDLHPSLNERFAGLESAVPANMFERVISERERRRPALSWWQSPRFKWAIAASLLLLLGSLISYQTLKTPAFVEDTVNDKDNTLKMPSSDLQTEQRIMDNGHQQTEGSDLDNTELKGKYTEGVKITEAPNSKRNIQNPKSKIQNPIFKAASNSTIITWNFETQNFNQNDVTVQNTTLKTTQLDYNPIIFSTSQGNVQPVIVVSPLNGLITGGVATTPLSHDKAMQAMPCQGPDAGCPTFGPSGVPKTFYIDVYGAPELAMRSLKAVSNEYTDYRNARDTTEKAYFAYSAGVRASVVFDNGIAVRAGAVYAQNTEKFVKDSFATGNIIWKIVQKPDGTRDTLSADIETGILRQTRYNRYRTIDFTLQLGYELPIADKITIGFNAGANINFYNNIKATVLGKDLQAYTLTPSNTIYNNSVGVSLVGSIAGYWNFTDRLQLMVEPQFRHYLRPLTKNPEYQLQQSYNNVGLAVGVRFRLNRNGLRVL